MIAELFCAMIMLPGSLTKKPKIKGADATAREMKKRDEYGQGRVSQARFLFIG